MKGFEATLAVNAILWAFTEDKNILHSPPAPQYGADQHLEELDTAELLTLVQKAQGILSARAVPVANPAKGTADPPATETAKGTAEPPATETAGGAVAYSPGSAPATARAAAQRERVLITKDYRIILPDHEGMELNLMPLPKTLFLFFLRHTEGVSLTAMENYTDELLDIYMKVSPRLDPEGMRQSIERVISLDTNSFHIQKTRLSKALSQYFEKSELGQYIIKAAAGGRSAIALSPALVLWE